MIITTYNQHVRLLSSEPFGWFAPPKSTRAWEPTLFMESLHSSYERGCQAKTLLPLSVRPRSVLASRPLFFVERILVLTPGAPQSMTGIRIVVAGLRGVVSCRGPTPFVAKLWK